MPKRVFSQEYVSDMLRDALINFISSSPAVRKMTIEKLIKVGGASDTFGMLASCLSVAFAEVMQEKILNPDTENKPR